AIPDFYWGQLPAAGWRCVGGAGGNVVAGSSHGDWPHPPRHLVIWPPGGADGAILRIAVVTYSHGGPPARCLGAVNVEVVDSACLLLSSRPPLASCYALRRGLCRCLMRCGHQWKHVVERIRSGRAWSATQRSAWASSRSSMDA